MSISRMDKSRSYPLYMAGSEAVWRFAPVAKAA